MRTLPLPHCSCSTEPYRAAPLLVAHLGLLLPWSWAQNAPCSQPAGHGVQCLGAALPASQLLPGLLRGLRATFFPSSRADATQSGNLQLPRQPFPLLFLLLLLSLQVLMTNAEGAEGILRKLITKADGRPREDVPAALASQTRCILSDVLWHGPMARLPLRPRLASMCPPPPLSPTNTAGRRCPRCGFPNTAAPGAAGPGRCQGHRLCHAPPVRRLLERALVTPQPPPPPPPLPPLHTPPHPGGAAIRRPPTPSQRSYFLVHQINVGIVAGFEYVQVRHR